MGFVMGAGNGGKIFVRKVCLVFPGEQVCFDPVLSFRDQSIHNCILLEAKGSSFHWCAAFQDRLSGNTRCYAVLQIDQSLFLKVLHRTILTWCKGHRVATGQAVGCTQVPVWTYLRVERHLPLSGRELWVASL